VAERVAELRRLRGLMVDDLPSRVPSLALTNFPEIPDRGSELKAVEDQLDAILAEYVAAHWWYWGREPNDVLCDSRSGYLVVPHRYGSDQKQADLRVHARNAPLDESCAEPEIGHWVIERLAPLRSIHRYLAAIRRSPLES
jgi:predicted RNase H-like nuclease